MKIFNRNNICCCPCRCGGRYIICPLTGNTFCSRFCHSEKERYCNRQIKSSCEKLLILGEELYNVNTDDFLSTEAYVLMCNKRQDSLFTLSNRLTDAVTYADTVVNDFKDCRKIWLKE
jgi:hypothetical protein